MIRIKILKSIKVKGICNIDCFSDGAEFTDWLIKDNIYEFYTIQYLKNNKSDFIINNSNLNTLHPDRLIDIPNEFFEEIK